MNEHVSYEYVMMKEMYNIKDGGGQLHMDIFNNMWNIVAYNTAYNLIEYMFDELDIHYDNEVARILDKVYHQIRTITIRRTAKQEDKLQPEDFKKLVEYIEKHKDKLGNS